ncbi:DUF1104 domain-containing protein [Arcobacter roscoffensis]|uniref:DUF1104 domain-containing protein n=1 Tax=Arcobacter roscoffensis TaxID=2961520 RepID=A0ABY5E1D9_9BACT|nr:DUF1104 domain-containing protein [Arcobacter roscoffensis]UTJ05364.1 DUF1104 domain-containing protein [Arcobacter roscoffensis]
MKKVLLLISFIMTISFAKVDYSEMSTQELIAIIGYVEKKNINEFKKELRQRIPTMNEKERKQYEKNKSKLK